jgi:hypothetical protein
MGKAEGKRPLGICRCKWEDNIKMDLSQDNDQWRVIVSIRVP